MVVSRSKRTLVSFALGAGLCFGGALGPPRPADAAGGKIDARLIERLHAAIASCWLPPPEAAQLGATARLRLSLRRDGSLDGEPAILDAQDDPVSRQLVASVSRAVKRCAPYAVLAGSKVPYEHWREIVLHFKPSE